MKASRPATSQLLAALLLMFVAFSYPAPAQAGSCTSQAGSKTDPTTGWSWSTLWYCGNAGGAQMYATPSKSQPVAVMNSTNSWFVCYQTGDVHNGGNNVWYYSLGDRPAGIWGYMPAENVWTDVDPWPGIPRCPGPASTVAVGKVRGDPVAITNTDGRQEVFAIGWDYAVWHIWQTSAGGAWSPWESLGGWADQLAVTRNGDGRVEIFVRGSDRAVHSRSQITTGNSVYYPWAHQGGNVQRIAVAQNLDGRLEVFAIGSDNALVHAWQTSQGGGWSGWASLGGWGDQLAVARNLDGRLEVFIRGSDKALHHRSQISPGGSWYDWGHRGGSINQIAVTQNAYGELEAFGIGTDRAVWHNWQVSPGNGTWSGWNTLGGSTDRLAAIANSDGRLEVFGRGSDGGLVHTWQLSISSSWSAWASLGGVIYQPSVERNRDGRLEVYARGTDSRVYHQWQTSAGGAWSGWAPLPTLVPAPVRCWNDPPDWFGHKESPTGARSDPVNLILCFEHGRTWDALFAQLTSIKSKTLLGQQIGFDRVYDPEMLPTFPDNHCISTVYADVQAGAVAQGFSAREGGCRSLALVAGNINHFRIWQQNSTFAAFMSASVEDTCGLDLIHHCVTSYDEGRNQIIPLLQRAAANAGWPAPVLTTIRAVPAGSITQHDDSAAPYDGNVTIITFK
jgi:acylphosphatase